MVWHEWPSSSFVGCRDWGSLGPFNGLAWAGKLKVREILIGVLRYCLKVSSSGLRDNARKKLKFHNAILQAAGHRGVERFRLIAV